VHSRRFHPLWLSLAATLALFATGCPRRIGDGCTQNIDCSLNADRRCDLAQPGGYCTIPECDPDRCPDQAMCVEFDSNVTRLARRFCMHTCNTDGDCRGGYVCTAPTVNATTACPPFDPNTQASFPACNRLVDTMRTPDLPTKYCVVMGAVNDAGAGGDAGP